MRIILSFRGSAVQSLACHHSALLIDVHAAAFALPLAALLIAYVLLARPAWFRDWVERLYRQAPQ